MNRNHLELCGGEEWAEYLRDELMPWALEGVQLGDDLVEIGPGPGATTELLRRRVGRLTAVEHDTSLAFGLQRRFPESNVRVVHGDGTRLGLKPASFSAAASFTMLHHVPSAELQDRLLGELVRVLMPGGVLVGVETVDSSDFREFHRGDICVPIDPRTFEARLRRVGFTDVDITVGEKRIRFRARTP